MTNTTIITISDEKKAKIIELYANPEFKASCADLATVEDLQKLFAEYDVNLTIDEVTAYCVAMGEQMEQNDELSEEDLENVVGGITISLTTALIVGGIILLGAFAYGVYRGYKSKRR